ncbi:MAG: UDP-N-acetylmuramate--L-alanine ligase [Mollicutes bacterium]|nr:UDP-N-acetylmuramate--L-alanine ligase [Mollicutes bacterium]
MKYYCIGIKGAGMSTLACILHDLGNEVSGYDDSKEKKFTEEGLNKRNIKIFHEANELDKNTIVTFSKAFSEDHPEIKRVKKLGLKIMDYNKIIGKLTKKFNTIGISGTHGKTTTSFMLTEIFENTIGCNYFVGDGTGFANPDNENFILEADEFNKHFLAYYPTTAVITNIELDHVESYTGLKDIIRSFKTYGNRAKTIIACGDDKNIRSIKFKTKPEYYGFKSNNHLVARNIILGENGSSFDVYYKNEYFDHYDLKIYGEHMIQNALATILVSMKYGIKKKDIKKSLENYKGAKRRFKEERINNKIVIDDYAHHPTEISATIKAAKQKYPNKEVIAIFLPNTYSRTEALLDDFVSSLSTADKAYIMDIYSDRERQSDYPNVSSDIMIERIPNAEKIEIKSVKKLLDHDSAVYCFMSCTSIYIIMNKFKEILKEK